MLLDDVDWSQLKGSRECLAYSRRDLEHLQLALQYVYRRDAVIQAGGNLGIFPKYLSRCFNAVYTFEPDPELFLMMTENAPEPNIIKIQAALGWDRIQVATSRTRQYKQHLPAHEGVTHISGSGIIPTLRIDDLNLSACNLIYLDIEGFELYALDGADRTIQIHRPVIAVEINQSIEAKGMKGDMVRHYIESHNYRRVEVIRSDEIYCPMEQT